MKVPKRYWDWEVFTRSQTPSLRKEWMVYLQRNECAQKDYDERVINISRMEGRKMAALNLAETKELHDAMILLDGCIRRIRDSAPVDDNTRKVLIRSLDTAKNKVKKVWVEKGKFQ